MKLWILEYHHRQGTDVLPFRLADGAPPPLPDDVLDNFEPDETSEWATWHGPYAWDEIPLRTYTLTLTAEIQAATIADARDKLDQYRDAAAASEVYAVTDVLIAEVQP